MKKWLYLIAAVLYFSCETEHSKSTDLLKLVPHETAAIIKSDNFSALQRQFNSLKIVQTNKELPFFKKINQIFLRFDHLKIDGPSLTLLRSIGTDELTYTVMAKKKNAHFDLDNKADKKVERFTYDSHEIDRYTIDGKISFSTQINDAVILSTSKIVLENIIRVSKNDLKQADELQKIYKAAGQTAILMNHKALAPVLKNLLPHLRLDFFQDFSDWTVLDVGANDQDLSLNGVSQSFSDKFRTLQLFKDISPQKNEIAQITPLNASGFLSLEYGNFKALQKNYREYSQEPNVPKMWKSFFSQGSEVGMIYSDSGNISVFKAKNPTKAEKQLKGLTEKTEDFRGKMIYRLSGPISFDDFFPHLLPPLQLNYYCQIDRFFLFSKTRKALENTIANYLNKTLLGQQHSYKQLTENLSDESSVLMVSNNTFFKKKMADAVSKPLKETYRNINFEGYPNSAIQIIEDNSFAHINAVLNSSKNLKRGNGTFQAASIQLPEPLQGAPRYFENWNDHHQYIAVQGQSNQLYLYNFKGQLLWKKELQGPILGEIQQLDIYGNKRIQMAFTTPHKLHLIDKTGKEVSPFPLDFNDAITQELAIFDYNNNHKFRFVITQGKNLIMIDKRGQVVKGFTFKGSDHPLAYRPKHVRIYGKDFILATETNGKLHILNRRGEKRIGVKEAINPSDNQWFLYKNTFTSTTQDGQLIQINKNGEVSLKQQNLAKNHSFTANAEHWAAISENQLKIDGKTIELDYGLYTDPQIFTTWQGTFVGITDTQASKTYLFDIDGKLWSGFPVYGNSRADLNNMDDIGHLELVVKGEDDRILIYQVD